MPIATGPPVAAPASVNPFAELSGWDLDDHAAALAAFRVGCIIVRNPALARVCEQALTLGPVDEARSRAFLEQAFRPEPVPETGLLTAYFAPEYEARGQPEGEFTTPVRPRPPDLRAGDLTPYPDRAAIEQRPAPDALAWMRPEDLFFLQIQGSGTLAFADGARVMAISDGTNGARFVGIAQPMRQAGLLDDHNTSGESIRAWLAAHRGARAQALMDLNPRYVFFQLRRDDGVDPAGAAGIPLIPGRSVALDLDRHALGDMVWIDAEAPTLTGAFPSYRRLAVALDTGGAIKGDARADLYMGRGPAAGLEAGRVRHQLRLYRLTPVER
jgi:membrane-bound lytic murein transglycosylase A